MRKAIIFAVAALAAVMFVVSAFALTGPGDDFQAIKKAVKENPSAVPGKAATFFRVQVTDIRTGKVDVQITLPISVIDIVSRCVSKEALRIHDHGCDIDLQELFSELKSLGPTMFIELTDHNDHVKVWLE